MKLTKEIIQSAADNADMLACPYSGRWMYGKQCIAIAFEAIGDLATLGAALAFEAARRAGDSNASDVVDAVEDMMYALSPSIDSLGLGYVAYWPSIAWTEES